MGAFSSASKADESRFMEDQSKKKYSHTRPTRRPNRALSSSLICSPYFNRAQMPARHFVARFSALVSVVCVASAANAIVRGAINVHLAPHSHDVSAR